MEDGHKGAHSGVALPSRVDRRGPLEVFIGNPGHAVAEVSDVEGGANTDLVEIGQAGAAQGQPLGSAQRRCQQSGDQGDDGDHREEFDQGEASLSGIIVACAYHDRTVASQDSLEPVTGK